MNKKAQQVPLTFTLIVIVLISAIATALFQWGSYKACGITNPNNTTKLPSYWFGKCYTQIPIVYESTELCGTFGFVCTERREPVNKIMYVSYCYVAKKGEQS